MKNSVALTLLCLCAISCADKFSTEELTIIDGIALGQSADKIEENFKSSNISQEAFYTKSEFTEVAQLKYSLLRLNYTRIFDISTFSNNSIGLSHIGILYPIQLIGTNKLIEMVVILAHTTEPSFFNGKRVNSIIGNRKCIEQECNELLINEIIDMYTSKYGTPKVRYKTKFNNVYVIEGTNVKNYQETEDEGELISWENEAMFIDFFTGCPSYRSAFLINPTQYIWHYSFDGTPQLPEVDYSKGQCRSFTYPYISYRLKNETIESLELDKKKI